MQEPLAHSGGHLLAEQVVAHVRGDDVQPLEDHLEGVARLSAKFAAKFQLSTYGELIGLVHDIGKYSAAFQAYIKSATGMLNQDEDEEFVDAEELHHRLPIERKAEA